jgi:hypothetical protein
MTGTASRKRVTELRQGIARAQDRIRYGRRMLDQFNAQHPGNGEAEKRTRRKLEADIARAENDEKILQRALKDVEVAASPTA